MPVTLTLPDSYGLVVFAAGLGPLLTNLYMAGPVMAARKKYGVHYPNLYGVPGHHKDADSFNRVQRGHQNFMEINDSYIAMTLLGGLKYPIACSLGVLCYCAGSMLYQKGYADTSLDVQTARYKKGGIIKWVGFLISLVSTCSLGGSLLGWF
mmetsp:Transcript_27137/g.40975  ORF Transcript_27137/g.40975 Transcript_27137/m.40975 type:complete len:152 (+) Transcript_27137:66-521(+)